MKHRLNDKYQERDNGNKINRDREHRRNGPKNVENE